MQRTCKMHIESFKHSKKKLCLKCLHYNEVCTQNDTKEVITLCDIWCQKNPYNLTNIR